MITRPVDSRRVAALSAGCAVAAALALVPAAASAGQEPAEQPRVRVTSASVPSGRMVGTLVGVDEQAVTVRLSGKTEHVRLEKSAISHLEVSRRRSNRGKAIGLGALAGAAVGGAVGLATESDCPEPQYPGNSLLDFGSKLCNDFHGMNTAAGVLIGAPVGALIGLALSHGERWETTSSERLRVAIAPKRGGGVIRVSFRF